MFGHLRASGQAHLGLAQKLILLWGHPKNGWGVLRGVAAMRRGLESSSQVLLRLKLQVSCVVAWEAETQNYAGYFVFLNSTIEG